MVLDVRLPLREPVLLLMPGWALQPQFRHAGIVVHGVPQLPSRQVPELVRLVVLLIVPSWILSAECGTQWLWGMPQGQVRRRNRLNEL